MIRLFVTHILLRNRLALTTLALVLLTTAGVGAGEWLNWKEEMSEVWSAAGEPGAGRLQQRNTARDGVEAEVITILPTGFQPSQITRPPGLFVILIDNRSGSDDLILKLDSVGGLRLREKRQTREEKIVRQLEDLAPGEYRLTEASHQDWVCRITITPR